MSKKIIILIIILFILLIGGIFGFFYYSTKDIGPVGEQGSSNFFSSIFPFGKSNPATGDSSQIDLGAEDLSATKAPKLRLVTAAPIAGAVLFGENTPHIRYIEKGTGHIYEADAASLASKRISNTTIPRIREALWLKNGTGVYLRYLEANDELTTFFSNILLTDSGEAELVGSFLPSDISSLSISPKGDQVFYLTQTPSGARGVVADLEGKKGKEIFASPVFGWLADWKGNFITLTTHSSSESTGISLALSPTTGTVTSEATGESGFTVLPNSDGKKILVTENSGGRVSLSLHSNAKQPLPVRTFTEKCVWDKNEPSVVYCGVPSDIPQGKYPDDWYMGLTHFSDNIWKIDTERGSAELLSVLSKETGKEIDTINLDISENSEYLLFTDKKTNSLWNYRLKETVATSTPETTAN